jgi:hypothetical protein
MKPAPKTKVKYLRRYTSRARYVARLVFYVEAALGGVIKCRHVLVGNDLHNLVNVVGQGEQ